MVLVFILLGILIFITILTILLISSTINIGIENFASSNIRTLQNQGAIITISLLAFDKIKWIWIRFDQEKITKLQQTMKQRKFDFKKYQGQFQWSDLKAFKKLKIKIAKLNLLLKLGSENAATTAFLIDFLASIISILLPHVAKRKRTKDYYYQLLPLYVNKTSYEIWLDCIIQVKMVHIFRTIYFLGKN